MVKHTLAAEIEYVLFLELYCYKTSKNVCSKLELIIQQNMSEYKQLRENKNKYLFKGISQYLLFCFIKENKNIILYHAAELM